MSPNMDDRAGARSGTFGRPWEAQLLAGGVESDQSFAVIELIVGRGDGPPRHRHQLEDETIIVLAGCLTVALGEQMKLVTEGECIVLPKGRDHSYRVDSEEARLLVIVAPPGLEATCLEDVWHGNDLERLVAVAARFRIDITGPALAETGRGDGD